MHEFNFLSQYMEIIESLLTVLIAGGLSWFVTRLFGRLEPRLVNTNRVWELALIRALTKPAVVMIWVLAFSIIIPIVLKKFGLLQAINSYYVSLRAVIFVITIFWVVLRYIHFAENRYEHVAIAYNKKHDKMTIRAIAQLSRVIVLVMMTLTLMQTLGIHITSLLAFGGIGALAVSYAAKDTLSNFLGGLMIYMDRPFSVGDWVRSPDRTIEGTVENIGWRLTRIRTFDKRPLYVPNGIFSTISIENPSRMTNRRIDAIVGLRYQDAPKLRELLRDVEDMLRSHPEIDEKQTLMVNLIEFGPSSLNIMVYTFTKTTEWVKFQAIQQDVFLKIIDIITQHGAECAFPTRTLHIDNKPSVQPMIQE